MILELKFVEPKLSRIECSIMPLIISERDWQKTDELPAPTETVRYWEAAARVWIGFNGFAWPHSCHCGRKVMILPEIGCIKRPSRNYFFRYRFNIIFDSHHLMKWFDQVMIILKIELIIPIITAIVAYN